MLLRELVLYDDDVLGYAGVFVAELVGNVGVYWFKICLRKRGSLCWMQQPRRWRRWRGSMLGLFASVIFMGLVRSCWSKVLTLG